MPNPRLEHLPPAIPKKRGSFRPLKYIIVAAILGSMLRFFPAINIFSAADNVGLLGGNSEYNGLNYDSPMGAIGSPHRLNSFGESYSNSTPSYTSPPNKTSLPNTYSTALIKAASSGDQKKVIELLSDGEPVNGRDSEKRTALIAAAYYGKNEICSILIDNAAGLYVKDKDGFTALDFAASRGLVDTVKLLLKKSKKPDAYNHVEYAMLMQAAFSSMLQYMPKGKGVITAINRISPEDKSPLHVAASGGSVDLVESMLNRGAKVNLTTKKGQTPLHWAAISNKTFVISLLLKKSAKINAYDNEGDTPLISAVKGNNKEAVMLLLAKGADRRIKNKKGEDAVTIAGNKGFSEIVTLLQKQ